MSYITNPIANRLNINKGYFNTFFVNNKAAYTYNIVIWLSLYLFLKSYLAVKKIKLLSCEIRIISQTHKSLLLSFFKNPKKKKKKAYNNRRVSPINKLHNKDAIYLLYQKTNNLKRFYINEKKKPHKNFKLYYKYITKLFTSYKKRKIFNVLKNKKANALQPSKISYKEKLTLNSFNALFLKKKKLRIKNISGQINELKRLATFFINNNNINNIWLTTWVRKQLNNIKVRKKKIKRGLLIKYQKFARTKSISVYYHKNLLKRALFKNTFSLKQLIGRKNKYLGNNNRYFLTHQSYFNWKWFSHNNKLYQHHFIFYKKQNKIFFDYIRYRLKVLSLKKFNKQKNRHLVIKNYKIIKKKIRRYFKLIRRKLLKRVLKKKIMKRKSLYYWYTYLLNYKKKHKKYGNQLKKKRKLIYSNPNKIFFNKKSLKIKIKRKYILKKNAIRFTISKKQHAFLLQWKKKICVKAIKKNRFRKKKKYFFKTLKYKKLIKKTRLRRKFVKKPKNKKYFLTNKSYIKNIIKNDYFKNRFIYTSLQLKFLLEKLISHFFHISLSIKLVNPPLMFNNKKIFFNIFKLKKYKLSKFTPLLLKSTTFSSHLNQFNILKLSHNLNKEYRKNIWKTKDKFFLGKKHKILGKSFFVLVNHRKYLNAQLLADEISHVMRKKKKHTTIFNIIHTLTDAIPATPIISYRITVSGKVNSKSRAENLTVVKGHIPNQRFLARINFGLAQAKTPTGTFGIRVWIYF